MRIAPWLVGCVAMMACGGARHVGGGGSGATIDAGLPVVGHNEVCYARDRQTEEGKQVATCAEGLGCCYPCGIPGCDSVCHTADECEADQTRP